MGIRIGPAATARSGRYRGAGAELAAAGAGDRLLGTIVGMANDASSAPTGVHVRAGRQSDAAALLRFERATLPTHSDERLLFADAAYAQMALTEEFVSSERVFASVAELGGMPMGCAIAMPLLFPGRRDGVDPRSMVLQVLYVEPEFRTRGVAAALLLDIEARCRAARQWVVVAHVPDSAAGAYRNASWEVLEPGFGFGCLPFGDFLRGDVPDPHLGFGRVAAKVLRPKALRRSFDFPVATNMPIFDALSQLLRIIAAGDVDERDLDDLTRAWLADHRHA